MNKGSGLTRTTTIALLAMAMILSVGIGRASADHDVEHRIAQFWQRVDALGPGDYLSARDVGQWALNVIERDSRTRITVSDFRAATAGMQGAMDRAGRAPTAVVPTATPAPTSAPVPLGSSRQSPAGPGVPLAVTVSSFLQNFDVIISEQAVIRGVTANQMVKAANQFNSDPKPGMEYLLVSLRMTYVKGPTPDTAYDANSYDFKVISSQGAEYANPFCVQPSPAFGTKLYAGASTEGWVCFMVNQADLQPTLAFGRKYDGSGGRWWRLGW